MSLTPDQLLRDESFKALGRRILTGRVAIFHGAGSSIGSGAPTTDELADLIGTQVLQTEERYPLSDMVDYADGGPGRAEVNRVIVDRLRLLEPSDHLLRLATFPWSRAFSVNFDDLFEQALRSAGQEPEVHYSPSNLEGHSTGTTPLYMLHGSIKRANDRNMGLLLTQDDLIRAATKRAAFYHQLTDSLQESEIVYVGFSLSDLDFRRVIKEVHDSVENQQHLIPRGYAVIPNPPSFARNYWETKKITIIDATMEDFAQALADLRKGHKAQPIVVGSEPILPRFLSSVNPASDLADELAWAFEFPELDEGDPNPSTFYRGAPPNWALIRDQLDATRDLTDSLVEDLLIDAADEPREGSQRSSKFVMVSGHAGSGKTTVAKRVAWSLSNVWSKPVVWVRRSSRLQLNLIETAQAQADGRMYVFVDGGADSGDSVVETIRSARRSGLRVTFVVSERTNEWAAATQRNPLPPDSEHKVPRLSNKEASSLLDKLQAANELGVLKTLPRTEQLQRLVERAERQLLVGLREVTEGREFDDIIESEFQGLPLQSAKRAYVAVCTLFQFGIPIRAGVLSRVTGVGFVDFGPAILQPASGVIIDEQRGPREQPVYTSRHSVIADVVFRRALRSSQERAEQIKNLLRQLDYGYRDDRRAFMRLISARWLNRIRVIGPERQEIHELARALRPDDASVIQQEGLAHRSSDPIKAAQLLQEAQRLSPQDDTIRHSQAMLLLDSANDETDPARQRRLFDDADAAFRRLVARRRDNSAPYVSLASLMLSRAQTEVSADDKVTYLAEAEKIIGEAFRNSNPTSHLFEIAANVSEAVGDIGAAEQDFERASTSAGPEPSVWITYARFLKRHRDSEAAIVALNRGIDLHPAEPSMNYELARLLEEADPVDDAAVQRAYGIAIAEPVRGHLPELDLAIYLHQSGRVAVAEDHFANLRASQIPYSLKVKPRKWIEEESGQRQEFRAQVESVRQDYAFLIVPSLDGRIYLDTRELNRLTLRHGNWLQVYVFYCAFGLRAVSAMRIG